MNAGPKVSQQNITQIITLPLPACHDVKKNLIHQTRPPSSIAPWSNFDAHVPIVGALAVDGSAWRCDWSVTAQPHTQHAAMHCVF
ncbi:hypothetical protein LDENG_00167660 [Lucifuga dentata]|nr:hypothetical protein LDENG_00167660 [Lucifuga dentata]